MYNKIFTKILDSSIWLEPSPTRIVWITLLAAMDENGFCAFAAVGNVAGRARVTIDEAREALDILSKPDPESSDPSNEGRRVERVPGGWIVLNAAKYREIVTRANAQEKTNERVKRFREKKRSGNASETVGNGSGTLWNGNETPSEAYTEAEAERKILLLENEIEMIYQTYPRKVGKEKALTAIEKAIDRLVKGKPPKLESEALEFLRKRTLEYANSPCGVAPASGQPDYRPYPATWFNAGRYLDDVSEWQKSNGPPQKVDAMSKMKFINGGQR